MEQGNSSTVPIDEGMSRDVPPAHKGVDPPSCVHVVINGGFGGESQPQRGHGPSWADSRYADYLYDDSVAFTSVHEEDDGETCLKSMLTMDTSRSLATMDTNTFRRVRALRREARASGSKGSSRDDMNKRKGGDAARTRGGRRGGRPSRHSSATTASSRRAGSDCSHSSLSSISSGTGSTGSSWVSDGSDRSDSSSVESAKVAGSSHRHVLPLAASLLISLGLVITRTGMDLVWLTTKSDRPGSLDAAKRRLQSMDYEGSFTPPHDGVDDKSDRRILLPDNDDEFNKLRAQIRGARQFPTSSEKYFDQALENLREQQQREPASQSEQERQEAAQPQPPQQQQPVYVQQQNPTAGSQPAAQRVLNGQQAHQKPLHPQEFSADENGNVADGKTAVADEEDGIAQELYQWNHLRAEVVGGIDLLSEDPFGTDSRNLDRRRAPIHLARSSLFTDEEKAELAKLDRGQEVDPKPEPRVAMNQASARVEEDPNPEQSVDVMTLGYERMKALYNV